MEDLALAADPELHYPVTASEADRQRWGSRVCFVGSYSKNREKTLQVIAASDLGVWGPGWDQVKHKQLKACVRAHRRLTRDEWLKIYAASDVVLNIQDQCTVGLSLRVWEVLASGACLLTNARRDVDLYLEGLAETFNDENDLKAKVKLLLENEVRRNEMRRICREHIIAFHTFRHRAETMLEWMEKARLEKRALEGET